MNLLQGKSVALCLYSTRSSAAPPPQKPAPDVKRPAEVVHTERITEFLEAILDRSGYVHTRVEGSTRA